MRYIEFNPRDLLCNKYVKPEDIGRAFILNYMNLEKNEKPILNNQEMSSLLSRLVTPVDQEIFNTYDILRTWIHNYHLTAQLHVHHVDNALIRIYYRILETITAEKALSELIRFPDVITQEEYNRLGKHNIKKPTAILIKGTYDDKYITGGCAKNPVIDHLNLSIFAQTDIEQATLYSFTEIVNEYTKEVLIYNKAVYLLSLFLELDTFYDVFNVDAESLSTNLDRLNDHISTLKKCLTGSSKEKHKKQKFIESFLPFFDIEALQPKKSLIEQTRILLPKFLTDLRPYDIICSLRS